MSMERTVKTKASLWKRVWWGLTGSPRSREWRRQLLDGLTHSGPSYNAAEARWAEERQAWLVEDAARHAASEEQLRHFAFLREVLYVFYLADVREDLMWTFDPTNWGRLELWAECSDDFWWGCADAEPIIPSTLPQLKQAYEDLRPHGSTGLGCLAMLYAGRIRGMRPQGAAYPRQDDAEPVRLLLDACGPERAVELGNPKGRPGSAP